VENSSVDDELDSVEMFESEVSEFSSGGDFEPYEIIPIFVFMKSLKHQPPPTKFKFEKFNFQLFNYCVFVISWTQRVF